MCGMRAVSVGFETLASAFVFTFAASTLLEKLASSRGSRRASPRSSFENDDRLEDGRGVSVLEIFFEKDEGVADAGLLSLLSGTSCSG